MALNAVVKEDRSNILESHIGLLRVAGATGRHNDAQQGYCDYKEEGRQRFSHGISFETRYGEDCIKDTVLGAKLLAEHVGAALCGPPESSKGSQPHAEAATEQP